MYIYIHDYMYIHIYTWLYIYTCIYYLFIYIHVYIIYLYIVIHIYIYIYLFTFCVIYGISKQLWKLGLYTQSFQDGNAQFTFIGIWINPSCFVATRWDTAVMSTQAASFVTGMMHYMGLYIYIEPPWTLLPWLGFSLTKWNVRQLCYRSRPSPCNTNGYIRYHMPASGSNCLSSWNHVFPMGFHKSGWITVFRHPKDQILVYVICPWNGIGSCISYPHDISIVSPYQKSGTSLIS
jgi:hypothetical protein